MQPLFTKEEFNKTKSREKLPCKCYHCAGRFMLIKHEIGKILKGTNVANLGKFCSRSCSFKNRVTRVKFNCKQCNKISFIEFSKMKKSINHFCSTSCSTTYNNKHKIHGVRVSSFEKFCQNKLVQEFVLDFEFNKVGRIKSELDIFIPKLNLAFEINGIFHYKPIFGHKKLEQVQKTDREKSEKCYDNKIELVVIDISSYRSSNEQNKQLVYDQISTIINNRLAALKCVSS